MLDISRCKVPTMEELFRLIDLLALIGYNELQLYIEHTFRFQDHETVWKDASPVSAEEIQQIDRYCAKSFIELVPNLNSFGHFSAGFAILNINIWRSARMDLNGKNLTSNAIMEPRSSPTKEVSISLIPCTQNTYPISVPNPSMSDWMSPGNLVRDGAKGGQRNQQGSSILAASGRHTGAGRKAWEKYAILVGCIA